MRVSIVMPVFNGETYFREAVDSILEQTFTDWELLIINEFGSNEMVTAMLQRYAAQDTRIVIIQNTERLGISASMNVGIDLAKGEYIVRMDADDISMPTRLEKQVRYMDEHPEIDICGLKPEIFGESTWDWPVETDSDILKAGILFFTPFVHPTIIIRKARLDQYNLRYNKNFRYSEDYELFAKASSLLRFGNLVEQAPLFRYRMHSANATATGGGQGVKLYQTVSKELFEECGLHFTDAECDILCVHTYPRGKSLEDTLETLTELDLLLKRILLSDMAQKKYGLQSLFFTLHRRWMSVLEVMEGYKNIYNDNQFTASMQRGLFYKDVFYIADTNLSIVEPRVSIVLPTLNSERYIMDTVYSLLIQTYTNFELLVVNEYGSTDDTVKILDMFQDSRIKIIQNKEKLGLAKSLNVGIQLARGEYIARADADDVYLACRLEKQVAFMDEHPDISVCGSWQRHFGKRNYIHMPVQTPEEVKAKLIFNCDICHSTLLLRKEDFLKNYLLYDANYLSEDFELWARASDTLRFYNIPEVLGEYRWDGENITALKMNRLEGEAQKIVARTLQIQLGITVAEKDLILLSGWYNPFLEASGAAKKELLQREKKLLQQISKANQEIGTYAPAALEKVLKARWEWASGNVTEAVKQAVRQKIGLKQFCKKVMKHLFRPFYQPIKKRLVDPIRQCQRQLWNLDGHLWDYKQEILLHNQALIQNNLTLQMAVEALAIQLEETEKQHNLVLTKMQGSILQVIGDDINAIEMNLMQYLDSRIWKSEENLKQTIDSRIWKSEENLKQTIDSRIWKAELTIKKAIKSDIWNLWYAFEKKNELALNSEPVKHSIYNSLFYEENRYGSVMSAHEVYRILLPKLHPQSMVDFGCGTGTWLYVAKQFGVIDVYGMDGDYVSKSSLMIAADEFHTTNLEEKIILNQQYDIAISLEVAEHLKEVYANSFVQSLCEASDIVLFSAAHPDQGGDSHLNEQPFEYWQEKFESNGFTLIEIRRFFEQNYIMEDWYKQNIALYVKNSEFQRIAKVFDEI